MNIDKKLLEPFVNWCSKKENRDRFFMTPSGHYGDVGGIPNLEKTDLSLALSNFPFGELNIIEKKVLNFFNFKNFYRDPLFGTMISYSEEGHAVHEHTDPSPRDEDTCVRINIFASKPDKGGLAIIDDEIIQVDEGEYWMCLAGEKLHSSQKVEGKKPRIMLSFGYQVQKEELEKRDLL